jgi:hypothetical protein
MHWKPIQATKAAARRESQSANKRLKWEYQCAMCTGWYPGSDVEVDHIEGAGSLRSGADLHKFVERLFCEQDKLRVLCNSCHDKVTYKKKEEL